MLCAILLSTLIAPTWALAQTPPSHHSGHMMTPPMANNSAALPVQSGQGAFAAIQEIVELLEADPSTDWRKVNIEALRQHLIDMDNVTLHARVESEPVVGGMLFTVSGTGGTQASIQRMLAAHATMMNGTGGWQYVATRTEMGATLTIRTSGDDRAKLPALGFIGVLARGMHHQMHHLMIAQGSDPHR